MRTAFLPDGRLVHSDEYVDSMHGFDILCIDRSCRAPLIHVQRTEKASSHFKTIGKSSETKHSTSCGFHEPLDVVESIEKVTEYQSEVLRSNIKKTLISLNMRRLDPDYETKKTDKDQEQSQQSGQDPDNIKIKDKNESPSSISSLKSIVQLITSYEPDLLSTIYFNIGNGRKVPLSSMVLSQERAHKMLWTDGAMRDVGYFIYGRVEDIQRREKVMYIKLEKVNEIPFTIVIFEKYFQYFKLSDEVLKAKDVLIYGMLRKNDYQDRSTTEILIKSSKYIEFLRRRK